MKRMHTCAVGGRRLMSVLRDALFMAVAMRQGFLCKACGRTEEEVYKRAGSYLEKHRKVMGIHGGTYHISNVSLVCTPCHRRMHPERKYLVKILREKKDVVI
jgi:hypothetical protein